MQGSILSTQKTAPLTTLAMFLLALFPVLASYVSSFNLNYGELALFFFLLLCLARKNALKLLHLPEGYTYFWLYVAFALIINGGSFKLTYLIPGGIAFFLFSTSVASVSSNFSIDLLYKFLKAIFYISLFIWFFQMLGLMPTQFSNTFILPISDHIGYDEAGLEELRELRLDSERPCSIFLEPAYYAQFLSIFLCLELFYRAGKNKLYTNLSIIVILVILFLRSGLGICCLAVLLLIKLIVYFKYATIKRRLHYIYLIPILIIMGVGLYKTDLGAYLLSRTDELGREGSSGFVRLIQGFLIYNELPLNGQLLGVNIDNVESMNLPFVTYKNGRANLFVNGLFTLLIKNGLIGFVLLVWVYINLYKTGTILARATIILLLLMSLIEQVYLGSSMLLCTIISYVSKSENENCVSVSNRTV